MDCCLAALGAAWGSRERDLSAVWDVLAPGNYSCGTESGDRPANRLYLPAWGAARHPEGARLRAGGAMKLKLSLPDLRRLAEVLVESVHLGRTRDIRLRDRLLNAIRDEMNLPYRRRQAD